MNFCYVIGFVLVALVRACREVREDVPCALLLAARR